MQFGHRFPEWQGGHDLWGPSIFNGVLMLVVLAVIVVVVVWLVTTTRRSHEAAHSALTGPSAPPADRALEEARMRYARGDITREEFQRLSEDLAPGGGRPTGSS